VLSVTFLSASIRKSKRSRSGLGSRFCSSQRRSFFAWCFRTFRRYGNSVEPGSSPAALITDGPFRVSRNPMYVGLLSFSLAFAVIAGSFWFLAATAALAAILDRIVIPREEKVMTAAFGEAYGVYRSRVRRWF
jgi:protein-S-isoprenylcysteine O-methyltransferase Ste14